VFYPTARVKGPQLLSRRVRRGNSTNVLSGLRGFRVGMFWVPSTDEDKRSLCDIITVIIGIVSTPVPGTTSPAWTAGACPHIEILIFISLPLEHFLKPCLLLFFCCVQKIVDCLSIGQLLSAARQLLERATVLLPFDTVLLPVCLYFRELVPHYFIDPCESSYETPSTKSIRNDSGRDSESFSVVGSQINRIEPTS
jgi:hypothetical protein